MKASSSSFWWSMGPQALAAVAISSWFYRNELYKLDFERFVKNLPQDNEPRTSLTR
jgi:hypothetical protein